MFTGLGAFPLTPLHDDRVDESAYAGIVERLAVSGVDSITALGSTGSYAYLEHDERRRVLRLALAHAGTVPVLAGVGATRTGHVISLAQDARDAGAAGILVAPVSYQALRDDDVLGLFEDLAAAVDLPVIVYDNPGTTHFTFGLDLYARIALLPNVASIKIPGVPADAVARVAEIRAVIPSRVTIGVSGDASAAAGLNAGCDAWYSVIAGTIPAAALAISRPALAGDAAAATEESARLQPLWDLFAEFGGSFRVVATIAEVLGLVQPDSMPRPLLPLPAAARDRVARVVGELGLS